MWSYTTFIRLYNSHEYSNGRQLSMCCGFGGRMMFFDCWLYIIHSVRCCCCCWSYVRYCEVWGGWFLFGGKRTERHERGWDSWSDMQCLAWQCASVIHSFRIKKKKNGMKNFGRDESNDLTGRITSIPATSGDKKLSTVSWIHTNSRAPFVHNSLPTPPSLHAVSGHSHHTHTLSVDDDA